jgi:hypothetical protein
MWVFRLWIAAEIDGGQNGVGRLRGGDPQQTRADNRIRISRSNAQGSRISPTGSDPPGCQDTEAAGFASGQFGKRE